MGTAVAEGLAGRSATEEKDKDMTNRHTLKYSILAAAIVALLLPAAAAAQWGGQNRYPDRDRDYGRDNGRGYGRYDERALRDSVHRLDKLAKDFERNMDRALDRSRANGSRREDQINNEVHQFRNAVGDLKSRIGNGRDLNRSENEARRVLQEGQQLDRIARPRWYDNRLASDWSQIQSELRFIGDVYGFRNGGYNRDDDWRRRDGRNDDYRRDRNDDYRRDDRRDRIDDWMRRIPFPQ